MDNMENPVESNLREDNTGPRVVKIVPSIFTEAVYLIEGKPFRFYGRDYLKTIYDTDIRQGLMKTGRQVEKSTTLSVKIGNDVLLSEFSRDLYVAPRNEQVKRFSRERLGKLFRYSKQNIVRRFYQRTDLTDQVFMKEFANGSTVYLGHCYDEGDNLRGLSIDNLYIDEVQDILVDAIPVLQETQFASDRSVTWFTGTPKTFGNTIEGLWLTSTMAEWVLKCRHCGKYQYLGLKNISPDTLICKKCGGDITSEEIAHGFWKERSPEKPLKGFHISQMMSPRAKMTSDDGKGIYQKLLTYPTAKFQNEVLGLSYENADRMITESMLEDIMANEEVLYDRLPNLMGLNRVFMGIDWGTGDKSFTVVSIFTMNEGKFQLIYLKKYDTGEELEEEHQMRHIEGLFTRFKVDLCVADWGFGFHQNKRLQKKFGKRVAVCYYTHRQKEKIAFDHSMVAFKVRRSDIIMEYIVEMIQNRGALWPGKNANDLYFLKQHHLVEQAEYRPAQFGRSEEIIFTHPIDSPDDGLHSCTYSYLASKLFNMGAFGVRSNNQEIKFISVLTR